MELSQHDDAGQLMQKLISAQNELTNLTQQLIEAGTQLNRANGLYHEIKARMRVEKEKIQTLKILIRAEGNSLSM